MSSIYRYCARLKMRKINDEEYYVGGSAIVYDEVFEEKIIDGKLYTHRERLKTDRDFDKEFSLLDTKTCDRKIYNSQERIERTEDWFYYTFSFDFLNIKITIYFPFDFSIIEWSFREKYSENDFVNIIVYFLDKCVKGKKNVISSVYTSTSNRCEVTDVKHLTIAIPIYEYGWNNRIFINIKLRDILKLDISKSNDLIKGEFKRLFLHNHFFMDCVPKDFFERPLTDKERLETINKIYTKRLNQNKRFRYYEKYKRKELILKEIN